MPDVKEILYPWQNRRLTLFEGGHDMLPEPAFEWLGRQCSGRAPDWAPGEAITNFGESSLDR